MQAALFGVAAHSTVNTPCGSRKLDEEQGTETIVTESHDAHHPRGCSALRSFPSIMTLPWNAGMDSEQGARAGEW
jgi:hypothetical protein